MDQVELATAVSLTGGDGRLNPAAVGWARRPILDTSGIVKGPHRTWGRTKRWEYWNVISPTHILSLTVSSIDYAAVHEVWIFERASGSTWTRAVTVLPARDVDLPSQPELRSRPSAREGPRDRSRPAARRWNAAPGNYSRGVFRRRRHAPC